MLLLLLLPLHQRPPPGALHYSTARLSAAFAAAAETSNRSSSSARAEHLLESAALRQLMQGLPQQHLQRLRGPLLLARVFREKRRSSNSSGSQGETANNAVELVQAAAALWFAMGRAAERTLPVFLPCCMHIQAPKTPPFPPIEGRRRADKRSGRRMGCRTRPAATRYAAAASAATAAAVMAGDAAAGGRGLLGAAAAVAVVAAPAGVSLVVRSVCCLLRFPGGRPVDPGPHASDPCYCCCC